MSTLNQWSTTEVRIDQVSNKNINTIPGVLAVSSIGPTHSVAASATVIWVVLEVVARSITACQARRTLEHNLGISHCHTICSLRTYRVPTSSTVALAGQEVGTRSVTTGEAGCALSSTR